MLSYTMLYKTILLGLLRKKMSRVCLILQKLLQFGGFTTDAVTFLEGSSNIGTKHSGIDP